MAPRPDRGAPSPSSELEVIDARWTVQELGREILDGVTDAGAPNGRRRVDLAVLPFFADERPLQGVAGLLDWRGCGRLSSYLRRALCLGDVGEQLLTVGGPGLPVDRIFMLGLGPREAFDDVAASDAGRRCVSSVLGLGAETVMFGLPVGMDRSHAEHLFEALVTAADRARAEALDAAAGSSTPDDAARPAESPSGDGGEAGERGVRAGDEFGDEVGDELDPGGGEPVDAEVSPTTATDEDAESSASGDDEDVESPEAADPGPDEETGEPGAADRADDAAAHDVGQSSEDPRAGRASAESGPERAERQARTDATVSSHACARWWVVAETRVVGRLRRVLSGPPRAASDA